MPLDVLKYYSPADSRYCVVEQSGKIDKGSSDSKMASTKIRIGAEIGIPGLVKAQIEWVKNKIGYAEAIEKAKNSPDDTATGDYGASSATGYRGAASATGAEGIAVSSGYEGKVMGGVGCAIVCCEHGSWDGEKCPLIAVKSGIVDGETLNPHVWYTVKGGEWVEVESES